MYFELFVVYCNFNFIKNFDERTETNSTFKINIQGENYTTSKHNFKQKHSCIVSHRNPFINSTSGSIAEPITAPMSN